MTGTTSIPIHHGYLLKRYRKAAGFSQQRIRELGGPSSPIVSGIENGTMRQVDYSTMGKLDAAFSWNAGSAEALLVDGQAPQFHELERRQTGTFHHRATLEQRTVEYLDRARRLNRSFSKDDLAMVSDYQLSQVCSALQEIFDGREAQGDTGLPRIGFFPPAAG